VPVPPRLTLVTLGVADLEWATRFYESLGWRRSSASQAGEGGVTFFSLQGSALGLFGRADLAADAGVPAAGEGFRGVSLSLNCDSPDEVDAVYGEWLAAGATEVKRPEPTPWGGYSSYLADPDGHLWEIAHNPHSPNGPDGRMQLPE
jgi:catechol 2,3-dioxygenase-like lactoylglutathione lyase family enzyme